jgi:hypothetical protein
MHIENNGPEIVSSNYNMTYGPFAFLYLSLNAGAFRILVPESKINLLLFEIKSAKKFIAIRMKFGPEMKNKQGVRIVFDDMSQSPYFTDFAEPLLDRLPAREDHNRTFKLIIYTFTGEKPIKKFEVPILFQNTI